MKLHPYHDAAGMLWPELDTREVTVDVMTAYLQLSRITIYERARRKDYGNNRNTGAWFQPARVGRGGKWFFIPAILWRVKNLGRYRQVGFSVAASESRVPIYWCAPTDTAKRIGGQPAQAADLAPVLTHVCGTLLEAMTMVRRFAPTISTEPLTFPNLPQENAR